jgi:hypothetical protein
VEVSIALLVIVVGLLNLLLVFTQAAVALNFAQEDLIAKQKAQQALESIYTARNTQQITFDMIRNTAGGGIFLAGAQPLRTAGADGLIGTADDGAVETLVLPGPDGLLGTADDEVRVLGDFTRQIQIDPVVISGTTSDDLRRVTVTMRYRTARGWERSYQISSYVSRYR